MYENANHHINFTTTVAILNIMVRIPPLSSTSRNLRSYRESSKGYEKNQTINSRAASIFFIKSSLIINANNKT